MFSGIVAPASVDQMEKKGDSVKITVDLESAGKVKVGDSVSINGVCLTVSEEQDTKASFFVMPETLRKTNLGSLSSGERVNLELSLKVDDRIGGHFVMGHIDGLGTIQKREEHGSDIKLWISCSQELVSQMVTKGSVALDGVSMTLVDVERDRFSVCVIPHTLEITTLGSKKEGEPLNIEIDMLSKYIKKQLQEMS